MAVKRFLLDTSELNDTDFGLDGFSPPFILDTSVLDGNGLLDGAEFLTTATGTATLGAMSATATSTVAHFATASAQLGELVAEVAEVIVTTQATAEAQLGGLVATATATVVLPATASADLGGLVATADTAPTPPPPEPEPSPSGGRRVYSTTPRKKIEPLPEVEIPVIQPKRRYAVTTTSLGGMMSQASAEIAFSILDDEAELLLML